MTAPRTDVAPPTVGPQVLLDVWSLAHVRDGLRLMARGRAVRALPGCRFAKLLGTGSGRTFTLADADPHRWAALTVWDPGTVPRPETCGEYERATGAARWRARFLLDPVRSRGRWSGREPFGTPTPAAVGGPVAVLTRARVRVPQWRRFRAAVPPVALDAHAGGGLLLALAVGESPIGLQGTFSVWESEESLRDFAYRRSPHRAAIRATDETGWYAEELFARFSVRSAEGSWEGRPLTDLLGTGRHDPAPTDHAGQ